MKPTPRYHFISGLPRSGSTLLSALLRQNPRFHAGMSSPVGALVSANIKLMSSGSEVALMVDAQQRRRILAGIFDSYHGDRAQDVVFDTNRMWCAKMPFVADMFPQAKVIACVRDVPWIMDSIERLLQKNPFENTKLFSSESERMTVYSRMAALARHDRLIGFPWAALKEAYYGPHASNLLLVDYDLLARAPAQVLRLVYQFIEEPWFDGHDFENVEFDAPEFDEALGISGLHRIRPKVAFEERATVLPPDIFEKYRDMAFWRNDTRGQARVIKPNTN
ncbi:sulfotransferase family protein [Pseudomonas yangonensis]|uniref:sulfotransferase family protein n=1 Tax=Pseudomonas yangonensis TaxID=2579922 RepID=UPI001379B8DD|nr:sulfotransferase [Pseudomonas yangonensis]